MMNRSRFLIAAVASAWLPTAEAEAVERQGFVWGFSLGGGALTCSASSRTPDPGGGCGSRESVAVEFHIGGMLGDRMAVLAEGYALSHPKRNALVGRHPLTSGIGAGAFQLWVWSDALWVKGGVGFGQLQSDAPPPSRDEGRFYLRSESAFAVLAGTGVEVLRREKFAVDVQGRFGSIFFDRGKVNSISGHVGFNWY